MNANEKLNKFVAFDLEIFHPFPDGVNSLKEAKQARPFGISCAALCAGELHEDGHVDYLLPETFCAPLDENEPMSVEYAHSLAERLRGYMLGGFNVVTWNGAAFDFDILAEECQDEELCKTLALRHIDMMVHFTVNKGYRLGIDAAHKGLGFKGKLEGMHGDLAPYVWMNDNDVLIQNGRKDLADMSMIDKRELCLRYVEQDALMTAEVYWSSINRNGFKWTSKKGYPMSFMLGGNWKTVEQCSYSTIPKLPFITTPMTWEDLVGWVA